MAEEQVFEMNYEQVRFYKKKKQIKKLNEIAEKRELTWHEAKALDTLKEDLWKTVKKFAISEMRKMTQTYVVDNDGYADMEQSLCAVFYEKLPDYDPTQSAPTTYFVRYFKQEINGFLLKNSIHLSQYDANNVKIVRRAINYYEAKGIDWTEEMIVSKTGLSSKVTKAALRHQKAIYYAPVDDNLTLSSKQPTPEDAYVEKETTDALMELIKEKLTPLQRKILEARVNLDGEKEAPYVDVARELGITTREVKTELARISAIAQADAKISSLYRSHKKLDRRYSLHDSKVVPINEQYLMDEMKKNPDLKIGDQE